MNAPLITTLLNKTKEIKTILILASIVCIITAIAYTYLNTKNKSYPMACTANFVIINNNENDLMTNVIINISRTNDNILTTIAGTLRRNGIETNISRSVSFISQETCCYSQMITKSINISSVDNTNDEYLKLIFPLYYLKVNETANILVSRQSNGDYIFSNGSHIYFQCKNTLS